MIITLLKTEQGGTGGLILAQEHCLKVPKTTKCIPYDGLIVNPYNAVWVTAPGAAKKYIIYHLCYVIIPQHKLKVSRP